MFTGPFLSFSSPPLLVTPFSRGIKQAAQPHFSGLFQGPIRGTEELWRGAGAQLGAAGRPQPSGAVPAPWGRAGLGWCRCSSLGTAQPGWSPVSSVCSRRGPDGRAAAPRTGRVPGGVASPAVAARHGGGTAVGPTGASL